MSDTEHFHKDAQRDLQQAIELIERTIKEMHARFAEKIPRVLVVDDDEADIVLLNRMLDEFYCEVETCSDAVEGEKLISQKQFDFVFLDQRMAKINGIEILRKTIPGNGTQFFIVSGFQESRVLNEAVELGALYIPKPVSRRLLATFLKPKNE